MAVAVAVAALRPLVPWTALSDHVLMHRPAPAESNVSWS
jgi:hypothetical protein